MFQRFKQAILRFDIYRTQQRPDEDRSRRNRLASRLYIALLSISISILILYTTQVNQRFTSTLASPTLSQYDDTYGIHYETLRCSCKNKMIPKGYFMKIIPMHHQICTSDFVSIRWYRTLYFLLLVEDAEIFPILGSSYFQALSFYCKLANQTFTFAYKRLLSSQFVNDDLLSRSTFHIKVDEMFYSFWKSMRNQFIHTILVINDVFRSDSYVSGLGTNFFNKLENEYFNSSNGVYRIHLFPQQHNLFSDNRCDCRTYPNCYTPQALSSTLTVPEGISFGCLLVDTVLKSSLQCWFNRNCTEPLRTLFKVHNSEVPDTLEILNSELASRFSMNATVENLLDEIMIEHLNVSVDYEIYFSACNVSSCIYTYTEKSKILYIITTIIGLTGGLSVSIRLLCPIIIIVILKLVKFSKSNHRFSPGKSRSFICCFVHDKKYSSRHTSMLPFFASMDVKFELFR